MALPLDGILVVDLSRIVAGPYAAMLLGDLGARVIKVERPEGDDTRAWGPPFVGDESTYFFSVNRNKESVVLDLKDEDDLAALVELVRRADVLVENFRPGVMDRLGLGAERLQELNPRLVVLSITAYGHDGPDAERPGYDQIVQGESGIMSLTGPDSDQPTKVGVPLADIGAGTLGAFGVAAALYERVRTGRGRVVRTSLLAAAVQFHAFQATRFLIGDERPLATGNHHPTVAPYGAFRCADGWVQIAVGNDGIWRRLAPLLGVDADDERFGHNSDRLRNRDELTALIGDAFARHGVEHWLGLFREAGVPAGEIKPLDRVYTWPQVLSQGLRLELDHPSAGRVAVPGPGLRLEPEAALRADPPPRLDEQGPRIREWLEHR